MPNLSVQIGADTSKLVQGINNAKQSLEKFMSDMHETAAAGSEVADVSEEQVQAYAKVIKKLESVSDGTRSVKQEQAALKTQLQALQDQWRNLSNEARSGEFGQSMSATISAVKSELAGLKTSLEGVSDVKPKQNDSVKKQLRETTNELVKLTAQYRAMSKAERQAAQGQELSRKMDELRNKAGELKDTIGDVNQEIQAKASDTPNLDVFNEALGIGADALSTYASLIAKVTGDEGTLKNAIATVMTVQSAANLVTKVTNALQSSSKIMLAARTVQEYALAAAIRVRNAAEGQGVVATKAATAAQKALNAVGKANPYLLIAAAAATAIVAIAAFTSKSKDAAKTEEELKKEEERLKKIIEEHKRESDTLGSKTADLVGQFKVLQMQWKSLRKEGEKKKFIEDNQSAFNQLGICINDVNDAYSVFVKNADKVIAALKAIAEAEAMQDLYKQSYAEVEKYKRQRIEAGQDYKKAKPSDYSTYQGATADEAARKNDEFVKAGLTGADMIYDRACGLVTSYYKVAQSGIDKINAYRRKQAEKTKNEEQTRLEATADYYSDKMAEAQGKALKARDAISKVGGTPKKKKEGKGDTSIPPVSGSLGDLENKLSELQKKYKDGLIKLTPDNYRKKVEEFENAILSKKIQLGLEPPDDSLTGLERQLSTFQNRYKDGLLKITPDDYKKKLKDIETAIENKKVELGLELKVNEGSIVDLERKIAEKEAEYKVAVPRENREKIKKELDALVAERRKIELEVTIFTSKEELAILRREYTNALKDIHVEFSGEFATEPEIPNVKGKGNEGKANKLENEADQYKAQIDALNNYQAALQRTVDAISEKQTAGVALDAQEQKALDTYQKNEMQLANLTSAYRETANAAYELNRKSQINKKSGEAIKKEIGIIGDLSSAAQNCGGAWKKMGEDWDKMTAFEKVTSVIDNTINSIESLISIYESIMDTIKLFGEISELAASKKVAANTSEMASDESLLATQTANTQAKVANDQIEMQSDMGKLGVKEGSALASATASGAAMPFPANIAAIAAGIAAVVAAFAMVFSAFAGGGIVSGGSYSGDSQIVRVNSGEMILNGQQQKRLFNLLNGTGSRTGNNVGQGGEVTFHIRGNDLYGVLNNRNKKVSKI